MAPCAVLYYDPILSGRGAAALRQLGVSILEVDEQCRRKARKPARSPQLCVVQFSVLIIPCASAGLVLASAAALARDTWPAERCHDRGCPCQATPGTLFYMPHGDREMYDNLLAANECATTVSPSCATAEHRCWRFAQAVVGCLVEMRSRCARFRPPQLWRVHSCLR